jgi:hypothetical protein
VDGKKKELIEPQVTLFRTDIPGSQYRSNRDDAFSEVAKGIRKSKIG